jgi:hypothetical protein
VENAVLKKRLNTYKTAKGTLKNVSDDVVLEVLRSWEHWQGSSADLCREIGLSRMQLVTMIQNAKRLVKSGVVPPNDFKEIKLADAGNFPPCSGIEICWDNGKLIRFNQVDQLVDFLKKVS